MSFFQDVGDFFEDMWSSLWGEDEWQREHSDYDNGYDDYDDGDSSDSDFIGPMPAPDWKPNGGGGSGLGNDYLNNYLKPKTFDEWLADQGLSQDVDHEDYFGSFYEKSADSLIEQALQNQTNTIKKAEDIANKQGTASHTAYDISSNNFSQNSERTFSKGLSNSGFSNYLKGISYLAYRDEMGNNSEAKSNAITNANIDYSNQESDAVKDMNDAIAKREKELLDMYNKDVHNKVSISTGLGN